ncbi:MAG: hypothetical protein RIB58_04290 [Phycisphaerales bacterium]
MRMLTQIGASLRLYMLLFSIPYALLWTGDLGVAGWIFLVLHSALLLFHTTRFDALVLREGEDPRLSLLRDRGVFRPEIVDRGQWLFGVLALLLTLILLVMRWPLGVVGLLAIIVTLILTKGVRTFGAPRRFIAAEFIWPLVLLIVPALFLDARMEHHPVPPPESAESVAVLPASFQNEATSADAAGAIEEQTPEIAEQPIEPADAPALDAAARGLPPAAIWATVLGGVLLGAWILLCLLRDRAADAALGLRSSATTFGRCACVSFIHTWFAASIIIAAWGVHLAWWHWSVAPAVALTALVASILVERRAEEYAVGAAWLGHGVIAVLLAATAM